MPGADREAEGSSKDEAGGQEQQWLWLYDPEVHVSSMLPACVLCQFLGTTKGLLVMCMTEGLCISGGVQVSPQWGRAWLWVRGSSPEAPLLCPRD